MALMAQLVLPVLPVRRVIRVLQVTPAYKGLTVLLVQQGLLEQMGQMGQHLI
jgi:hypothetical protein